MSDDALDIDVVFHHDGHARERKAARLRLGGARRRAAAGIRQHSHHRVQLRVGVRQCGLHPRRRCGQTVGAQHGAARLAP